MRYYVLKCTVNTNDFSEESYGVLLLNDDASKKYICNISDKESDAVNLVNKLNSHHIEPCHICSVIEDFKYGLVSNCII